MNIAIIGTGYVGLVTGACLSEIGHKVTCIDINKLKIANLKKGIMPIYEPGLAELVHKNQQAKRLFFALELSDITMPEVIFFALPTPPGGDGAADLSYVKEAAEQISKKIKKYTVFVNKSTVPVGTHIKIQEIIAKNAAVICDVVSNPEFLREGFAIKDFMESDRIVIGTSSAQATEVMSKVYAPFSAIDVPLLFMDEYSAEMTKYAANSFLATKISFMNEIANLCELLGADVDNVKKGIGYDQRIGQRFLQAGIGYGGSCFPKDVMALSQSSKALGYDFKILQSVMDVNARQKKVLTVKIAKYFGDDLSGKVFAVWGLAFKPDTDDVREAPAIEIVEYLLSRGATVQAYDPEAADNFKMVISGEITYSLTAQEALAAADALIILTEWEEFYAVDLSDIEAKLNRKMVFDGRNIFKLEAVAKTGLTYISIGRKVILNV